MQSRLSVSRQLRDENGCGRAVIIDYSFIILCEKKKHLEIHENVGKSGSSYLSARSSHASSREASQCWRVVSGIGCARDNQLKWVETVILSHNEPACG